MDLKIIEKIKEADLTGRGGAGFPTWQKWEAVRNAPGRKKYIIVNGSEGEPGVMKDGFILEKYPEEVVNGLEVAFDILPRSEAYIYLRKDYYDTFKGKLEKLTKGLPITIFREPGRYLCGEETTLIESIEGNRFEPRDKPPYVSERGLFGMPTLVNNLETFYWISKISKGEYERKRFYSLSGDIKKPGVYELPVEHSIEQILNETGNFPKDPFFVQVGGGASGTIKFQSVKTHEELNARVEGAGSLIVYDKRKTDPVRLMKKWIDFYFNENCGKCVPCREGVYRIKEMLDASVPKSRLFGKKSGKELDVDALNDILFVLKETSFCPLGKSVEVPFQSLLERINDIT